MNKENSTFSPAIRAAADEAAKPITLARAGSIRAPAIVYAVWPGCGDTHDYPAIAAAAGRLGVNLYKIPSVNNPGFDVAEAPGEFVRTDPTDYGLYDSSANIRFIDASGRVVGDPISSQRGADAIVKAF